MTNISCLVNSKIDKILQINSSTNSYDPSNKIVSNILLPNNNCLVLLEKSNLKVHSTDDLEINVSVEKKVSFNKYLNFVELPSDSKV